VTLIAALEERARGGNPDFSVIPGIAYRDADGKFARSLTPPMRRKDIDDIPWPAWDLTPIEKYLDSGSGFGVSKGRNMPIVGSRGCPYACTFCSNEDMWTRKWEARDYVAVVDEIEHYHQTYGAVNFPFQDLTAILKRDWIIDFCKELLARDLKVTWQFPSGTRCEVIDDEVAQLLAATGGRSLAFAPESGSERTRKLIKKRMKTESLMNAVDASVRNKLNIPLRWGPGV
ncbi:MAG: radical SAM protein, partial [Acidiferrobacterales bacterium]|nr:radical SAM protein [Acidiferrobacterales bacterium]